MNSRGMNRCSNPVPSKCQLHEGGSVFGSLGDWTSYAIGVTRSKSLPKRILRGASFFSPLFLPNSSFHTLLPQTPPSNRHPNLNPNSIRSVHSSYYHPLRLVPRPRHAIPSPHSTRVTASHPIPSHATPQQLHNFAAASAFSRSCTRLFNVPFSTINLRFSVLNWSTSAPSSLIRSTANKT